DVVLDSVKIHHETMGCVQLEIGELRFLCCGDLHFKGVSDSAEGDILHRSIFPCGCSINGKSRDQYQHSNRQELPGINFHFSFSWRRTNLSHDLSWSRRIDRGRVQGKGYSVQANLFHSRVKEFVTNPRKVRLSCRGIDDDDIHRRLSGRYNSSY